MTIWTRLAGLFRRAPAPVTAPLPMPVVAVGDPNWLALIHAERRGKAPLRPPQRGKSGAEGGGGHRHSSLWAA